MPTQHTIEPGDCFESIALQYGFFAETLWNHADNTDLRDLRKDRNILMSGDVVHVPDLDVQDQTAATEQRHRFRRKGVPARLRMKFLRPKPPDPSAAPPPGGSGESDASRFEEPQRQNAEEFEPIASAPFNLDIDGKLTQGKSDAEGMVDVPIPPGAYRGSIKFNPGTETELVFQLALGELAPVDTVLGARMRLHNLGYRCLAEGDEVDAPLAEALQNFQSDHDLTISRQPDAPTQRKLKEVHGT